MPEPDTTPACVWPDCLTPDQQAQLADQVAAAERGETTTTTPDQRGICGCAEARTDWLANVHPTSEPYTYQPLIPCSWGVLKQSHDAHSWEPQPGVPLVHCVGFEAAATARPAPKEPQGEDTTPAACGFRHDEWDGPYRMPRRCTAPAGHSDGQFAYDHGPWEGLPKGWVDPPAEGTTTGTSGRTETGATPQQLAARRGPCLCGRQPDPGICPGRCESGLRPDGHCACACGNGTSDSPAFTWAQTVASHGAGPTVTIDIDIHAPGHSEPVPVEIPLADARTLHAMLSGVLAEHEGAVLAVRDQEIQALRGAVRTLMAAHRDCGHDTQPPANDHGGEGR